MGKYADMLNESRAEAAIEAPAIAAAKVANKAAYESSGAAKQLRRVVGMAERPGVGAVPAVSAGSVRGKARGALEMELGLETFDGHVQGPSFGRKTR